MKKLSKLQINFERLMRNEELKMVKGGVGNVYAYDCTKDGGDTWVGCVVVEGDVYDGYTACKQCWPETTGAITRYGDPSGCQFFIY